MHRQHHGAGAAKRLRPPADPRLHTLFEGPDGYVTARRERFAVGPIRAVYINEIRVPAGRRGQGIASAMLDAVLAAADRSGTWLLLEPYPDDGLDYPALVAWYERRGFRRVRYEVLLRPPRTGRWRRIANAVARWWRRRGSRTGRRHRKER